MKVGAKAELVTEQIFCLLSPLLSTIRLQVPFLRGCGRCTQIPLIIHEFFIVIVRIFLASAGGQQPLMPAKCPRRPLERLPQAVIELVDVFHAGEGCEEKHQRDEAADIPEGVPDGLRRHHDVDLCVRKVQLHVLVVYQVVPADRLRDR